MESNETDGCGFRADSSPRQFIFGELNFSSLETIGSVGILSNVAFYHPAGRSMRRTGRFRQEAIFGGTGQRVKKHFRRQCSWICIAMADRRRKCAFLRRHLLATESDPVWRGFAATNLYLMPVLPPLMLSMIRGVKRGLIGGRGTGRHPSESLIQIQRRLRAAKPERNWLTVTVPMQQTCPSGGLSTVGHVCCMLWGSVNVGLPIRLKLCPHLVNDLPDVCPHNAEASDPHKPEVPPGFYP